MESHTQSGLPRGGATSRRRGSSAFAVRPHGGGAAGPPAMAFVLATLVGLAVSACADGEKGRADAAPPAGCVLGEFDCQTGHECVQSSKVCDGTYDCSNGHDEVSCGCGPGMFTCKNDQCIHAAFVCDKVENCLDGSDEEDCP